MPDHQSPWDGNQIDGAIGRIINGELDKLVGQAATSAQYAQQAETSIKQSIATIPPGAVPVINDLTTGGPTVALSAEMGKVLRERLDTYAHPNLLVNPNFSVNRQGKTEYSGAVCGPDCWAEEFGFSGAKLTVTNSGVTLTSPIGNNYSVWYQYLNCNLWGKTVTFSALTASGILGTKVFELPNTPAEYDPTPFVINEWNFNIYSYLAIDARLRVRIYSNAINKSIQLAAVKLELGDHQTLARQLDDGTWQLIEAPDYARDYALCQMYSPLTGEFVGSQNSNPNLLLNWYLKDPVNQRTQTVYTAAGYTIDMLYNRTTNTKLTLTDKGLKIEVASAPGGSKNQFISQRLENYKELLGKTVTLSFLVPEAQCRGTGLRCFLSASNSVGLNTQNLGGALVYAKAHGLYAITTTLPDTIAYSGINAAFLMHDDSAIGDYATVAAWKLELGPVSTLAHREGDTWVLNDPPPCPAAELAKCQRYQQFFLAHQLAGVVGVDGKTIYMQLPGSVALRANPAVTCGGIKWLSVDGSYHNTPASSAVTFDYRSNNITYLKTTLTSITLPVRTPVYINLLDTLLDSNL